MSNEIKVGDTVRFNYDTTPRIYLIYSNISVGAICIVDDIQDGNSVVKYDDGEQIKTLVIPTKYLIKVEDEAKEPTKNPNVGKITIPVKADLTDSYWDAYAAELAKEVALKVANKYNDPKEVAEYAVKVAKAVVEGLKRK